MEIIDPSIRELQDIIEASSSSKESPILLESPYASTEDILETIALILEQHEIAKPDILIAKIQNLIATPGQFLRPIHQS